MGRPNIRNWASSPIEHIESNGAYYRADVGRVGSRSGTGKGVPAPRGHDRQKSGSEASPRLLLSCSDRFRCGGSEADPLVRRATLPSSRWLRSYRTRRTGRCVRDATPCEHLQRDDEVETKLFARSGLGVSESENATLL